MARNQKVVPEAKKALDMMKYEIAAELGLPVGKPMLGDVSAEFSSELGAMSGGSGHGDWGTIATRDAGAVGGTITARLVRKAEDILMSLR